MSRKVMEKVAILDLDDFPPGTTLQDVFGPGVVVVAVNGADMSGDIAIPGDEITVPAQMAMPIITLVSPTAVTITRAAAPDDGNSPILHYNLRYSIAGGPWIAVEEAAATVSLTDLAPGTEVKAETTAVNAVGAGPWSPTRTATTARLDVVIVDVGEDGVVQIDTSATEITTLVIVEPARFAGTYPIDPAELANGPIILVPPTATSEDDPLTLGSEIAIVAPLVANDASNGRATIELTLYRDDVELSAGVLDSYTVTEDDNAALLVVSVEASDAAGTASSQAPGLQVEDFLNLVEMSFSGNDNAVTPLAFKTMINPDFSGANDGVTPLWP